MRTRYFRFQCETSILNIKETCLKHIYSDSYGEMDKSKYTYHAYEYTYGNVRLFSITFFQNFDVLPTRFHVIRIIILSINTTFKCVRRPSTALCFQFEKTINIYPNFFSIDIMDNIQLEPPVIDARNQDGLLIIRQRTIVDSDHCGGRMRRISPKHLHDTYARRPIWHIGVPFELPNSR